MIQGEHSGKVELSLLSACWVLRFLGAFVSEVAVLFCESFRACNVFKSNSTLQLYLYTIFYDSRSSRNILEGS